MFLTRETLPAFRERANTLCRPLLDDMKKRIDALPAEPGLEFKADVAEMKDGKLVFKKLLNDQNAAIYAVKTSGGTEALECAILYLATGDRAYFEKSKRYLKLLVEFVEWSDRCRILPEWFNNTRLSGLVAYDWLYNELTPEERRGFLGPMLKHVEHMQNPGYMRNGGGPETGNYGEPGLQLYAGLAAYGDGIDDARAEKLLRNGYRLNTAMMNLRDEISGGSGLLTSICSGYSFGQYPWASYNFLHVLESAAGIDGTEPTGPRCAITATGSPGPRFRAARRRTAFSISAGAMRSTAPTRCRATSCTRILRRRSTFTAGRSRNARSRRGP